MKFTEIENEMNITAITDKKIIERHFRKNTDLNLYSIGDLDDFFWKYTKWYAIGPESNPLQIVLLYKGTDLSTFLAITDEKTELMMSLIERIKDDLPLKIYCHLSKGLVNAFGENCEVTFHGTYFKMSLKYKDLLLKENNENIRRLRPDDIQIINNLYDESYPDNFFDERMLGTGKYFGYFDNAGDKLSAIAGIHVYSEKYKVATLGNITVMPALRGKSVCQMLTSALCNDLLKTVDNIGLNVSINNPPAISCYKKIGFDVIAEYEEYLIVKKL